MQLSFEQIELDTIEVALKRLPYKHWSVDKILTKISQAEEKQLNNKSCKHKSGKYVGVKTCCTLCGSFYKNGQGFGWSVVGK